MNAFALFFYSSKTKRWCDLLITLVSEAYRLPDHIVKLEHTHICLLRHPLSTYADRCDRHTELDKSQAHHVVLTVVRPANKFNLIKISLDGNSRYAAAGVLILSIACLLVHTLTSPCSSSSTSHACSPQVPRRDSLSLRTTSPVWVNTPLQPTPSMPLHRRPADAESYCHQLTWIPVPMPSCLLDLLSVDLGFGGGSCWVERRWERESVDVARA